MSLLKAALDNIAARALAGYEEVPDDVHAEAQEIEHTTDLNYTQAFVVAADEAGLEDSTINREIVASGRTVREVRRSLRRRKLELEGEKERSRKVLDGWD